MPLTTGARLGPYEILGPLGAGGMGEVYRARDTRLGRDVAVKVLPTEFATDPDRIRRFEQEARAASALNHANILTIHDVGRHDGAFYVVSELLDGETLRWHMARRELPVREAVDHAIQIVKGLAAAHGKGIVHRDLKPENVFVTPDGQVKILDFGLAKRFRGEPFGGIDGGPGAGDSERETAAVTEPGMIVGTAGYMSPEQVRGKPADHRSDIFSFGSILYEMLTGRRAFAAESGIETLTAILREEPPDFAQTGRAIPAALERIVRRCIEKSPEKRFQSAQDVAFALEEALTSASQALPLESGSMARPRRSLRRPLVVLGLLTAGLLLLLAWDPLHLRARLSAGKGAPIRSLAVLPLANLSGDASQDYFADGMTEALIADLARIRALSVISRTSVMRYKGSDKPLPEIARELGVDGVVEGSVMRSGNRVRITAQLIHAATDRHLWAENYERELSDVLNLQSEVARAVAEQVRVHVTDPERETLVKPRRVDPAAYESYLRALYAWNQRTSASVEQAIHYFRESIAADPAYAPAWAGLADSYIIQGSYGWVPPREIAPLARAAAQKALEIEPTLAQAHTSLGGVSHFYDRDPQAAEKAFQRALESNPSYATAHHWYGNFLVSAGRFDEALSEMEKARMLDPLSLIINTNLARVHYFARRYDRAIALYEETLKLDPNFGSALWKLRFAYQKVNRIPEAYSALERWLRSAQYDALLGRVRAEYERSSYAGAIRKVLENYLGVSKRGGFVDPNNVALLYATLDEKDEAFRWLERACEERSGEATYVNVEPVFEGLHDDARFRSLLKSLNIPAKPSTGVPR